MGREQGGWTDSWCVGTLSFPPAALPKCRRVTNGRFCAGIRWWTVSALDVLSILTHKNGILTFHVLFFIFEDFHTCLKPSHMAQFWHVYQNLRVCLTLFWKTSWYAWVTRTLIMHYFCINLTKSEELAGMCLQRILIYYWGSWKIKWSAISFVNYPIKQAQTVCTFNVNNEQNTTVQWNTTLCTAFVYDAL